MEQNHGVIEQQSVVQLTKVQDEGKLQETINKKRKKRDLTEVQKQKESVPTTGIDLEKEEDLGFTALFKESESGSKDRRNNTKCRNRFRR